MPNFPQTWRGMDLALHLAPESLQDIFICHLAPSGKPPSWENLLVNGDGDRMKKRISPFVNKRDKRRITAWLCVAITLK